jgi:hypothetical protein
MVSRKPEFLPNRAMRRELSTRRFSKTFCKSPKSAQGQHFEIAHDGVHEIKGEILLTLFDIPEMVLLAAYSGRDDGLGFTPSHAQFRNRQSKNLSWRIGPSRVIRTNGFGHMFIVAIVFPLKQQL